MEMTKPQINDLLKASEELEELSKEESKSSTHIVDKKGSKHSDTKDILESLAFMPGAKLSDKAKKKLQELRERKLKNA